ncbi:MAG: hypothetical protein AAFX39_15535 [Pseudomonadota bacterium]
MTVRPLRPEDRERWEELWAGYLTFYEEDLPAEITDLTWRRLHDPLVDLHGIVFERDGTIVGLPTICSILRPGRGPATAISKICSPIPICAGEGSGVP